MRALKLELKEQRAIIIKALSEIPAFGPLDYAALERIADETSPRDVSDGEVVARQDDPAKEVGKSANKFLARAADTCCSWCIVFIGERLKSEYYNSDEPATTLRTDRRYPCYERREHVTRTGS